MNNCYFDRGEKCSALTEKECKGCKFRKTEEEMIQSRNKAQDRIKTLPTDQQLHIREKYVGKLYRRSKS